MITLVAYNKISYCVFILPSSSLANGFFLQFGLRHTTFWHPLVICLKSLTTCSLSLFLFSEASCCIWIVCCWSCYFYLISIGAFSGSSIFLWIPGDSVEFGWFSWVIVTSGSASELPSFISTSWFCWESICCSDSSWICESTWLSWVLFVLLVPVPFGYSLGS